MKKQIAIAIDGPAAAGKSTVAKMTANTLNYTYIDTGAMYRALTYYALMNNVSLTDGQALLKALQQINIYFKQLNQTQHVYIDDQDVTAHIRSQQVTNQVSQVAAHAEVRDHLLIQQQEMAYQKGVVMDGRDIGTHVLPLAELKVFLIASVEERARRRYDENVKKGIQTSLADLTEEIKQRDYVDSHRETAPLIKAKDALEIDTTALTIQEVVDHILIEAYQRIKQK